MTSPVEVTLNRAAGGWGRLCNEDEDEDEEAGVEWLGMATRRPLGVWPDDGASSRPGCWSSALRLPTLVACGVRVVVLALVKDEEPRLAEDCMVRR